MPRIFMRAHSVGEFKHKNSKEWQERRNKMLGRGQPLKREGINLGDIWDDCSPHSTQPVKNRGRDLHARK